MSGVRPLSTKFFKNAIFLKFFFSAPKIFFINSFFFKNFCSFVIREWTTFEKIYFIIFQRSTLWYLKPDSFEITSRPYKKNLASHSAGARPPNVVVLTQHRPPSLEQNRCVTPNFTRSKTRLLCTSKREQVALRFRCEFCSSLIFPEDRTYGMRYHPSCEAMIGNT